jgi:c(7)-type cytochrome triheme protein
MFILLMLSLPFTLHAVEIKVPGGTSSRLAGKINIQTKNVGTVAFSHRIHRFSCTVCHPKIFIKKRNSNHTSMKDMEEGKSCGACHNGAKAFSVKGDCVKCHADDIPFQDEIIGKTIFPHSGHVEQFGCDECHPGLYKAERGANEKATMKDMENGESCGACHDGSTAFSVKGDCTTCHAAGKISFDNKDIGKIVFPHSVHLEQFTCTDCHPAIFTARQGANPSSMKDMENGESCGACHDGSTAFSVTGDCTRCHIAKDIVYQDEQVGKIIYPHSAHITQFTCYECHPKRFKAEKGMNRATMRDMAKGESCGGCHDGSTAFSVKGDCDICHVGAVDIIFKLNDIGEIKFSHGVHVEIYNCKACHPDIFKAERGANKTTMEDMENGESCGDCHDGAAAFSVANCVYCHTSVVDKTFTNKNIGNIPFPHSFHAEQFNCKECHPDIFKAEQGANPSTMKDMEEGRTCGACHDGSTAFSVTGNCTTCHTMAEDIIFRIKDKNAGEIAFPHTVHVDKLSWLECQPEVSEAESTAKRTTMQKLEKGETCKACHDGAGGFGVAGQCDTCHRNPSVADIVFSPKDLGKTIFLHSVHTAQFSCTACHPEVFRAEAGARVNKATMLEMDAGKSCGACHDGSRAFSVKGECLACHFLCL